MRRYKRHKLVNHDRVAKFNKAFEVPRPKSRKQRKTTVKSR